MMKLPHEIGSETATEEWRKVPSLSPDIEVSSFGNIRRYTSLTETTEVKQTNSQGYKLVCLNGKQYAMHKLVAEAFLPNPERYTIVRHKDGVRDNNVVSNLMWSLSKIPIECSNSARNRKNKVYCVENNCCFDTLRTASLYMRIPQELISKSIYNRFSIMGYTFTHIDEDDGRYKTATRYYIDLESVVETAKASKSVDDFYNSLKFYKGDSNELSE